MKRNIIELVKQLVSLMTAFICSFSVVLIIMMIGELAEIPYYFDHTKDIVVAMTHSTTVYIFIAFYVMFYLICAEDVVVNQWKNSYYYG
jgi:hypothetical protein